MEKTAAHYCYVRIAPCAASKKQKAERLANAELIFAFAQLRGEGTQIDPHGLRKKPKMPKIINLGNCVKLLWDTTF